MVGDLTGAPVETGTAALRYTNSLNTPSTGIDDAPAAAVQTADAAAAAGIANTAGTLVIIHIKYHHHHVDAQEPTPEHRPPRAPD